MEFQKSFPLRVHSCGSFPFPDVSQLISMVTPHTMKGSTTRPAPLVCCPKTPPCSLASSQRDDTFSSLVRLLSFLNCRFSENAQFLSLSSRFFFSPPQPPSPVSWLPFRSTNRRTGAIRVRDLQEAS